MDPNRYAEVCRHFEAASALHGDERDVYLNQLREEEPELAADVGAMLQSDQAANEASFLEEYIAGYSQLTPISRGGQGTVYRAVQNRTGQRVAVKIVQTRTSEDGADHHFREAIENFAREIQTVATLRHPNIVRIYDAGDCAAGQFFVMELIDGGTLAEIQPRLNQHKIARFMQSMAEAVLEAHTNGILHLDIKPQNILYDERLDQPFLVDFGLARLANLDRNSGRIAGTIAYMAPEQFTSGQIDERTDVFGLGATMLYLLTGSPVRQSSTVAQAREQRPEAEMNELEKRLAGVNRELAAICRRCLESDPDKRYQTVRELARELERFRETEDVQYISRGSLSLKTSWILLVINAAVYGMLRTGFADQSIFGELLTWLVVFSMYVVVFATFYFAPLEIDLERGRLTMTFLWSIWVAKMLTAVVIAISMRINSQQGSDAILLSYPMFAALSGMALCSMAPRMWRTLYVFAAGMWITGILMMAILSLGWQIAPLIYGTATFLGMATWGLYLRNIAHDMARTDRESSYGQFTSNQAHQETVLVDS